MHIHDEAIGRILSYFHFASILDLLIWDLGPNLTLH